jgi:hypothetical protein
MGGTNIFYLFKSCFSRTCVKTFTLIPQVSVGAVLGQFTPWSRLKVPKNQVGVGHHISVAFRALSSVTTHIALDQSYLLDKDIHMFLTDTFEQIKSAHPLRAYIPLQWPLPDILKKLIKQSSGQFIHASTIMNYVSSIRHNPLDRLDFILGIRPPNQRDLPFSQLDALYHQILAGAKCIEPVLEILAVLVLSTPNFPMDWSLSQVGEFLFFQPGDVELYLGDLNSVVYIGADEEIRIVHASFSDFLMDRTRSKEFWIHPKAAHTVLARHCLDFLQPNSKQ